MSDRDVLLLSAGALLIVAVIPISKRLRVTLVLLVIGLAAWWEFTSGLLSAA